MSCNLNLARFALILIGKTVSEETFGTNRTFNANRRAIHKGKKKVIIGDSSSDYGLPIDIRTCCHKLVGAVAVEEAAGNWEVY